MTIMVEKITTSKRTTDGRMFALSLVLRPEKDGWLPLNVNQCVHGAFLGVMNQIDPRIGNYLHAANQRRPYTIAPLTLTANRYDPLGKPFDNGTKFMLYADRDYYLRVTILDDDLFRFIMRGFLGRPVFWLGGYAMNITDVRIEDHISYGDLYARGGDSKEITLKFLSGTAFSDGKDRQRVLFPHPERVWGHLARTWNEHTPPEIAITNKAVRERAGITVLRSNLITTVNHYDWGTEPGFKGVAVYQIDGEPEIIRQINILASFADYASIGYKTAMGMGQARRVL